MGAAAAHGRPRHNLAAKLSSFVGRELELSRLAELGPVADPRTVTSTVVAR
jgi:hypothetical protein